MLCSRQILFAKHNSRSLCSSFFNPDCDSVTRQPDSFANRHLTLAPETIARRHRDELLCGSVRVQSPTQVGVHHCRCVIDWCQVKKAFTGRKSGRIHVSSRHGWSVCSTHFQASVLHFGCPAPPRLQTKCNTNVTNNPIIRQTKLKTMTQKKSASLHPRFSCDKHLTWPLRSDNYILFRLHIAQLVKTRACQHLCIMPELAALDTCVRF